MTNSLGLPDSWCSIWVQQRQSTHHQLHLFNRRKVSTTLLDYPVSLEWFPVYYTTSGLTHHIHFHPLNFNQHCHQCHLPLNKNGQDLQASPASRVSQISRLACIKSYQPALLRATWIFQKQLFNCLSMPKNKKAHCSTLTLTPDTRKKLCEWMSECWKKTNKLPPHIPQKNKIKIIEKKLKKILLRIKKTPPSKKKKFKTKVPPTSPPQKQITKI